MSRTLFTNARLLDGTESSRTAQSIAVEGNRIVAVGPQEGLRAQPADQVIDVTGKTLMPGMVQAHFHATFSNWGAGAPQIGLERPAPVLTLIAESNVKTALDCGFTSVVGSTGPDYIDCALQEGMQRGLFEGPRILAGSHEIAPLGLSLDGESRNYYMGLTNSGAMLRASGPEEFRRVVRTEIGRGAEIVKIAASEGHALGGADDREITTYEELASAAQAAHGLGAKIRAHAASRRSILDCAKAGFDVIDHADRLDERRIEALLESGSTIIPSMLFGSRLLSIIEEALSSGQLFMFGADASISESEYRERVRSARADFENMALMLPIAHAAGVKIAIGDDFGVAFLPHGDYACELEFYVKELGIPAREVLSWATRGGAALMKQGEELGTIAAGQLADLIVVEGDPEQDIGCLRESSNIRAVMVDGILVKDVLC
jgi:imidazolonepropionase-like amidohydrolase